MGRDRPAPGRSTRSIRGTRRRSRTPQKSRASWTLATRSVSQRLNDQHESATLDPRAEREAPPPRRGAHARRATRAARARTSLRGRACMSARRACGCRASRWSAVNSSSSRSVLGLMHMACFCARLGASAAVDGWLVNENHAIDGGCSRGRR